MGNLCETKTVITSSYRNLGANCVAFWKAVFYTARPPPQKSHRNDGNQLEPCYLAKINGIFN